MLCLSLGPKGHLHVTGSCAWLKELSRRRTILAYRSGRGLTASRWRKPQTGALLGQKNGGALVHSDRLHTYTLKSQPRATLPIHTGMVFLRRLLEAVGIRWHWACASCSQNRWIVNGLSRHQAAQTHVRSELQVVEAQTVGIASGCAAA